MMLSLAIYVKENLVALSNLINFLFFSLFQGLSYSIVLFAEINFEFFAFFILFYKKNISI